MTSPPEGVRIWLASPLESPTTQGSEDVTLNLEVTDWFKTGPLNLS